MFSYSLAGLQLSDESSGPAVPIEENEITARSAVYQVLGRLVSPLERDTYEKALDGRWQKELDEAAELLPFSIDLGVPALGADVTFEASAAEHERLFGAAGAGSLLCASNNGAAGLDDVRRFFEYFGLAVATDGLPNDHLATECDFMQFVSYKEAAAPSPRLAGSYRRAQIDFLDRHLLPWVPALAEAVAAKGPVPFLGWTTELTARFVAADHAYLTA